MVIPMVKKVLHNKKVRASYKAHSQQQQAEYVQVVQAAGGGDAREGLNTSNNGSCTAKRSSRQAERENFRERLLAKLPDEGPEYDETDLAMLTWLTKLKWNLSPDAQEEVIEELQLVVTRHCYQAKFSRSR